MERDSNREGKKREREREIAFCDGFPCIVMIFEVKERTHCVYHKRVLQRACGE
jgi:hypothetical protein